MALIKLFTASNGATGNYWNLSPKIELNIVAGKANVRFSCYKDAAFKTAGGKPLAFKDYIVDIENLNGNIREQVYAQASTLLKFGETEAFFANATDHL
jgi:hypothetical protein